MHNKFNPINSSGKFFISDIFGWWILSFYWLGIVFYDLIDSGFGFSFIDELMVFCLVLLYLQSAFHQCCAYSPFLKSLFIISFYFIYSIIFGVNIFPAILSDLVVVAKSIFAFIIFYSIKNPLNLKFLFYLKWSAIFGAALTFLVAIYGDSAIVYIFNHPSRLATTAIISALLYLFSVILTRHGRILLVDLLIFLLILSISLFSERAKAYGFFVAAVVILIFFFINRFGRGLLSLRNMLLIFGVVGLLVYYVTFNKLFFYFVEGVEVVEMFARPALYFASFDIAIDYFPFGAGFSSFGSYYSGIYYSPLYFDYGLSNLWGLTPDYPWFISDTFFPMVLAQFGFFGLFVLIACILVLIMKLKFAADGRIDLNGFLMLSILFLGFLTIESFADSTVVQNRGVFSLALLGIISGFMINDRRSSL
jgi:hypothetical protein